LSKQTIYFTNLKVFPFSNRRI